ncbi:MAG: hypothetical protein KJZ47_02585 [Gemmatimonadales bacterium]|nr:hypothetical protein [Gemmatimonadales bacterium]
MSISSVPGANALVRFPGTTPPTAPAAPAAPAAAAQPAARQPGLWSILSRAERMFFEVPEGTGVLGYGPGGAPTEVAPVVGQQLDVRA